MPLPDILKRRKNEAASKSQTEQKSPVKIREPTLPLDGIEAPLPEKENLTVLVTCVDDILVRNVALGYFMQFLEAKSEERWIKFWLDVTSFQATTRNQAESSSAKSPVIMTEDAVQMYQRYVLGLESFNS